MSIVHKVLVDSLNICCRNLQIQRPQIQHSLKNSQQFVQLNCKWMHIQHFFCIQKIVNINKNLTEFIFQNASTPVPAVPMQHC